MLLPIFFSSHGVLSSDEPSSSTISFINLIEAQSLQLSLTAYSFPRLRLMMLVTVHHPRLGTECAGPSASLTVLSTVSNPHASWRTGIRFWMQFGPDPIARRAREGGSCEDMSRLQHLTARPGGRLKC